MKNSWILTTSTGIALAVIFFVSLSFRTVATSAGEQASITTWMTTEPLTQALTFHQAVVQGNFIYVSGGRNANEIIDQVYSAEIKSDGQLAKWQTLSTLPTKLYQHAMVATTQYVYVIGGWDGSNSRKDVWRAQLQGNGKIGNWESIGASPYPVPIYLHDAVIVNGRIYVLGGVKNRTERTNQVYYTTINPDGSLGGWQEDRSLPPSSLYRAVAVATTDTIYVTGGWDGTKALNTIYYSKVNADGKLAEWQAANMPENTGRYYHEALLFDNKLLILGGTTDGAAETNTVSVAPIQSNGSLDAWTNESTLPQSLQRFAAATTGPQNGKFYHFVLGGQSGAAFQNQVYGSSFTLPTPAIKAILSNNPPRRVESGGEIEYTITYWTVNYPQTGGGEFTKVTITNTIPVVANQPLEVKNLETGVQKGNAIVWEVGPINTAITPTELTYVVKLPDTFQANPTPPPTPFVVNQGAEASWEYNGKPYSTTTNVVFNNSPVIYLPFLPNGAGLATPTATP